LILGAAEKDRPFGVIPELSGVRGE
jgi:hypothetical protein